EASAVVTADAARAGCAAPEADATGAALAGAEATEVAYSPRGGSLRLRGPCGGVGGTGKSPAPTSAGWRQSRSRPSAHRAANPPMMIQRKLSSRFGRACTVAVMRLFTSGS